MRHIADGGFKEEGGGVPALERGGGAGSLALAMWALNKTEALVEGIDALLQAKGGRGALAAYCCIAGAIYGYGDLPSVWIDMLHANDKWLSLADEIYQASRKPSPGEVQSEEEVNDKGKAGANNKALLIQPSPKPGSRIGPKPPRLQA